MITSPGPQIKALLIDADGVIQRRSPAYFDLLSQIVSEHTLDEHLFMKELFDTELPSLIGKENFSASVYRMLKKWHCTDCLGKILEMWNAIEPVPAILDLIASIRKSGIFCGLASNQEEGRARYMSTELGYGQLFHQEFYSYRMGHMKPDPLYFKSILAKISLPASDVLFIDDIAANVKSAESVGLNAACFQLAAGEGNEKSLKMLLEEFKVI